MARAHGYGLMVVVDEFAGSASRRPQERSARLSMITAAAMMSGH
jgi:hypothetical protein